MIIRVISCFVVYTSNLMFRCVYKKLDVSMCIREISCFDVNKKTSCFDVYTSVLRVTVFIRVTSCFDVYTSISMCRCASSEVMFWCVYEYFHALMCIRVTSRVNVC